MCNSLEKNYITEKLNKIFKNRFEIDLFSEELAVNIDDNILGKKFRFRARDLIYLVYDIEKEFNIIITDEDIDDIKLNTLRNIITVINKELEQAKRKIV
ncbi:peptide maturation system acyl carrier-related protein [Ruminiclostridium josui]|uniref:peptide maturation system acyl carrier-related protein n=1 Tax=Ruminiclostridium josui TaxID=1499 RepID=UPI000466BDFF|nr:peptide maturation system acyl carrier-related protein [Ruminiclostridium josui]